MVKACSTGLARHQRSNLLLPIGKNWSLIDTFLGYQATGNNGNPLPIFHEVTGAIKDFDAFVLLPKNGVLTTDEIDQNGIMINQEQKISILGNLLKMNRKLKTLK